MMIVYVELDIVMSTSTLFIASELLGQAWMKPDKGSRAPHVLLVSKRFNEVDLLHQSYSVLSLNKYVYSKPL